MNKEPPLHVLEAYEHLGQPENITVINMGLINKTWLINTQKQAYILQEVSHIFDLTIHDDAWAVCQHISRKNLPAPMIEPTQNNCLYFIFENRVFRALTYLKGQSFHQIINLTMAEQAGTIVGRFHQALVGFNYDYRSKRRQAGDFVSHINNLAQSLQNNLDHEYFPKVNLLGASMINNMTSLINNLTTTSRHIHGDPKISNILFDSNYNALALVDFDTLNKSGWSLEIADALRSWCNPNKEDVLEAYVDLEIARQALGGYGEIMKGSWSAQERAELVINMQAITLCLAMRYLSDVFYEKYWAYDATRYARAADHNLIRAQAMYNLYKDFARKKLDIAQIIDHALSGGTPQ
jgi:Ser/Thr protein kinase RdoA (MazF antagonist)